MLKLFRFLKPFRLLIGGVVILTVVQTMSELILPVFMAHIVDVGIVNRDLSNIVRNGLLMLVIALVGAGGSVAASYLSASVAEGFGRTLRQRIYTKVEGFSLSTFQELGASSLITRTTNDVTQVQNVVQIVLRVILLAPILGIGGVIMALSQDVALSLVLLITIPLLVLGMTLIVWKGMPLFKVVQQRIDKINQVVREGLSGVRVIRAFHRLQWQQQRFNQANTEYRDTFIQVNKIMALNLPLIMLAFNMSTVMILWLGTERIVNQELQVGQLMAFIQYATMILMSIVLFSFLLGALPRAIASAARINELLAKETEEETAGSLLSVPIQSKPLEIEFRGVSYRYPGAGGLALQDISFKTKQGEITAIIGRTGAGKSTLLHMLPRLYEPENGCILLNGVNIKEIPLDQLRAMIGIVTQRAVLFSGSVQDNIRYGTEGVEDAAVVQAAVAAQAAPFIDTMTQGYRTEVSQGGTTLSGGQKQRISIARALVRQPQVCLFDDSFSALDYKTEAKVRGAIRSFLKEAAVLIVAQRVRTVMDADRILVLDEGKIAAAGTHEELMMTSSIYRDIVRSQEQSEEDSA